jgi:hypothetical protein
MVSLLAADSFDLLPELFVDGGELDRSVLELSRFPKRGGHGTVRMANLKQRGKEHLDRSITK